MFKSIKTNNPNDHIITLTNTLTDTRETDLFVFGI